MANINGKVILRRYLTVNLQLYATLLCFRIVIFRIPTKSKMKMIIAASSNNQNLCLLVILFAATLLSGCEEKHVDRRIKQMDPAKTARIAASVESVVKPELADGLTVRLWGVDSLVISPIAIDIDDSWKIYYATTNRQKNSEFDIRGHQDWEIASIQLANGGR